MKTQRVESFWAKTVLVTVLSLLQISSPAQVQWYQNQDGNNQLPAGTTATSVQSFTRSSFAACYLWRTENDTYTWKISKTHVNGTEQKTMFISGILCMTEIRVSGHNTIYVLQKNFPLGANPEYLLYRLDSNLNIQMQRTISFPGNFNIFNMSCFELDRFDNIYLAGDGQYSTGYGYGFASFILKMNKNMANQWSRMDSIQTSYTRLHIDRWGRVIIIEDFYEFFPDLHIKRISSNGQYVHDFTIETDPGRFSLFSAIDDLDNLFVYGGISIGDTLQAMYLYKLSKINCNVIYRKTLFKAPGSQINDVKFDRHNKIFALLTIYPENGNQQCRISKINSGNGAVYWNYSMPFAQDSCNLMKLVISSNDKLYAIGQRSSNNYFSKGYALKLKKNGQLESVFPSPDSVAFQRMHWLADGITGRDNQLIAVGGTSDLDTTTFMNTYLRAFAVGYANSNNCKNLSGNEAVAAEANGIETDGSERERIITSSSLIVFPNPVQTNLTVSGLLREEYNNIIVYNMQGAVMLQQKTDANLARVDISSLTDGVYMLVLRSSVSLKEKSMKFVVRK